MSRRLPPLNALRAFEAAARHGSFLGAGRELNVTPGAISQQVRTLEARLGMALFRRLHRGIVLTEAGTSYLPAVREALDALAAATDELVSAGSAKVIRITALPALAEKWLVPRLPRFRAAHPDVDVELTAEARLADFAAEDFDVGLRYSDGDHPELSVTRLFTDEIFPVCSPRLLRGPPALRTPEDLADCTLLYDEQWAEDWSLWFAAAGLDPAAPIKGDRFSLYSMAIDAAIKGLGVAMGHGALVAEDLAAGRLVAPFAIRAPAPRDHHVVCPRWADRRPTVRAFRTWLLSEADVPPSEVKT